MKLRIIQANWDKFNGNLGGEEFVDGESVHDLSPAIAQRIAAVVLVEEIGTGRNPSASQALLDNATTPASTSIVTPDRTGIDNTHATVQPELEFVPYTREQLEKIASDKGIQGIREIATPAGLSGRSINELIDRILEKGLKSAVQKVKPATTIAGDDTTRETEASGADQLAPSVVEAAAVAPAPAPTQTLSAVTSTDAPVVMNDGPAMTQATAAAGDFTLVDPAPTAVQPKKRIVTRPAEEVIAGSPDEDDMTVV